MNKNLKPRSERIHYRARRLERRARAVEEQEAMPVARKLIIEIDTVYPGGRHSWTLFLLAPYASRRKRQRVTNPDVPFRARSNCQRFEILSARSGRALAEGTGAFPRFSLAVRGRPEFCRGLRRV